MLSVSGGGAQLWCAVQANQQVQDAWAQVKGKEPLNRRNTQLRSSSSNAAGQAQQPPSQQPQQQQPQPDPQSNSQFNHQNSDSREGNQSNHTARPSSRRNSQVGRPDNAQGGALGMRDAMAGMQNTIGMPSSFQSMPGVALTH